MKNDLKRVYDEEAKINNSTDKIAQMFQGPVLEILKLNPETASLASDPEVISMVAQVKQNPRMVQTFMQGNEKFMKVMLGLLQVQMKQNMPGGSQPEPMNVDPEPQRKEEPKKKEPEKEPEPELSNEEKESLKLKEEGNAHYKKKEFDQAIDLYTKAFEKFNNLTYLLNRAAAKLEKKAYTECEEDCNLVLEKARETRADFKIIAKAYARLGSCYAKQEKYDESLKAYDSSLMEHRVGPTLTARNKVEKLKKEQEIKAYLDPEKGQEAKLRGNEFFKEAKWPEAIKEYTEAIKRDPNDHTFYSNRAAAYMKLGEMPTALKDCVKCLEIKPDFVKAISRKAACEFFMKEYYKALETYEQGLKLDPNHDEMKQGYQRCLFQISKLQSGQGDAEAQARAQSDPEIQNLLRDPAMQAILQEMQQNPQAAMHYMQDPKVSANINKLINAGILKVG